MYIFLHQACQIRGPRAACGPLLVFLKPVDSNIKEKLIEKNNYSK